MNPALYNKIMGTLLYNHRATLLRRTLVLYISTEQKIQYPDSNSVSGCAKAFFDSSNFM